jgi:ABC-type transport system involved in multi-copper enzyme maturation permease subunit
MISLDGVLTVARQEIKLRIRAGRWRWLLGAWFVVLGVVTFGIRTIADKVANVSDFTGTPVHRPLGVPMFGGLMLFVLALALLLVPALTGQSVNGDRERGVLATLQVTLLSPLEIALGKLAAAWGVALVFLGLTAPWVGWSYAEGGVSITRVVAVAAVIALLLGVFCATSLGLSSLLARTTTSAVLSYVAVFGAVVGTLIVFGIAVGTTTEHRTTHQQVPTSYDDQGNALGYTDETITDDIPRPDRVWWLLAPNPFVVLADAAPVSGRVLTGYQLTNHGRVPVYETPSMDVLSSLGNAVREVRKDPVAETLSGGATSTGKALWPTGLAVDVVIGGLMVWVTARRLRTPSRRLARGQRVA